MRGLLLHKLMEEVLTGELAQEVERFADRARELVAELMSRRKEHCFPANIRSAARRLSQDLLSVLFPHFSDEVGCDEKLLDELIERVEQNLHEILASLAAVFPVPPQQIVRQFVEALPQIHRALLLDAKAIYHGDPAAVSADEVILSYPGFYAIANSADGA